MFSIFQRKKPELRRPYDPIPIRDYIDAADDPPEDGGLADFREEAAKQRCHAVKGHVIHFDYVNNQGDVSSRQVRISSATKWKNNYYVNGYCFLRQAPRMFNAAKMTELVSVATGEIYSDGLCWLRDYADELFRTVYQSMPIGMWRRKMAVKEKIDRIWESIESPLVLIFYIARFDGRICEGEESLIDGFIKSSLAGSGAENLVEIKRRSMGLFPDEAQADAHLMRARRGGKTSREMLLESVTKVSLLDQDRSEKKQEMVYFLTEYLGR